MPTSGVVLRPPSVLRRHARGYRPTVTRFGKLPRMTPDAAGLTCFDCGYDLRHTPPDGRCPECGLAVAETRARLDDLATHGEPRRVGRACWLALAAAAAFGLPFLAIFLLLTVVGPFGVSNFEALVLALVIVLSTVPPVLVLASVRPLLRRPPPRVGRLNRRMLGFVGWLTPALMLGSGVSVGIEWVADDFSPVRAVIGQALLLTGIGSLLLYPGLLVGEVARRVGYWPRWPLLRRSGRVVQACLLLTSVGIILVGGAWLLIDGLGGRGLDPARRPPAFHLFVFIATYLLPALWLGFGLAMVAWLAVLAVTLVGVRRVRDLVGPPPGGTAADAGTPATPPGPVGVGPAPPASGSEAGSAGPTGGTAAGGGTPATPPRPIGVGPAPPASGSEAGGAGPTGGTAAGGGTPAGPPRPASPS